MAAPAAGLAASSFALLDATDGLRLVIDLLDPGEALFAGPPECRRAARAQRKRASRLRTTPQLQKMSI
jgi:hypothetical protein